MQDSKQIDNLLTLAEKSLPQTLLPNQKIDQDYGQSEWYDFEHEIWRLGEEIRACLTKQNNYKLQELQINRIVDIAINPNAKRGRQSFIMLLGYKKYQLFSDLIASQINDECVDGHVINTLYKMQAPNYSNVILPFTTHKVTWIRNIAKKYIDKYNNLTV